MAVKLDRWEGADEHSRDEAFAELYEASYPSLVKYCRGLLGGAADPEEVAQEAFLRAWTTWDRYSTNRPFWALVATIARNLCMDHHRHARVVSTVLEQRAGELTSAPGANFVRGPRLSISSMSSLLNVSKFTPLSGYGFPSW